MERTGQTDKSGGLVQQLIQGEVTENEIQTGMIAFVRDKDGFSYRTIMNESPSPGVNQFSFDSEEGFLQGMNQLEKTILSLRDQAGLTATDLYLEQVKNKIQSESRKLT